MQKTINISVIIFLILFGFTQAEQKSNSNVRARLFSSQSEITPGDEITLAVEFKIKNKWHIYWENPGDAGMATTLEFALPEGFEAGKVLYPYPDKFMTEGLTSYGYKNKTVLLTKIKAPNNLKINRDYKIKVKALWLECKDICIPGDTELELTLKAIDKGKVKKNNTFKNYLRKIPRSLTGLETNVQISEKSAKLNLKFPDYFDHNSLNFDIYPLNEAIFVHSQKPKISKDKSKFLLELDFDPFKVEIPEKMEFVLVLDDKNAKIIDSKSVYFKVVTKKK